MPQSQDQQSKRKWAGASSPSPQQSDGSLETSSGQKESPKSPVNDQKQTEKSTGGEKKEKSGKGSFNKRRGGKAPQQSRETVKDITKETSKSDMSGLSRSRRRSGEDDLDGWDPMKEDYNSPVFNSYGRPSVVELTTDFHGRNRDKAVPTGSQLYVSGIPKDMTDEGFTSLFQSVGPVKESRICISRKEHLPFTFGFVTMNTAKDATRAIQQLNGYKIGNGLFLTVRIAEKDPPHKKLHAPVPNFQPSGRSFNNNYSQDGTYYDTRRGRHLSGDGRHEVEEEEVYEEDEQQDYQEDEEEGPYYEDIDSRNLHRKEDGDREIEESSYGELKVHVRRSNSREYEDNTGKKRRERRERGDSGVFRERGGRGGRGGHRSSGGRQGDGGSRQGEVDDNQARGNSDDSDGFGRRSPSSSHSSRSEGRKSPHSDYRDYSDRSPQPGLQLGLLEQQQVFQQLAAQLNVANSFMARMSLAFQPSLLGPPMGLLGPVPVPVPGQTTASLEDVTHLATSPPQGKEVSPPQGREVHTEKPSPNQQTSHSEEDREEKPSSVKSEEETTPKKTPVKQSGKEHSKTADVKQCINCGKPGTKRCSVCQSRYCSSKCQVDHWPTHQPNCKPMKADEGTPPGKVSKDSPKDSSKINMKQYSGIDVSIKDVQTVRPTKREMMVCVTYIESLSVFWVQIFTEENAKQWEALENLMQKEFNAPSTHFPAVDPKVGHLYASGRDMEDVWYRSEVLALPQGDKVHVHFSDFGDKDMVPKKKLRQLNEGMIKAPLQGVKCSLKGISPINNNSSWSQDANIRFESLVLDHRLIVHFEKPNPKLDVCFITKMKDENGVDIFEELVKSGVAEREPRQGGTNKPSASPSNKVGTKKIKDEHQGEGTALLPDPVQKTLKVDNSITIEITGINQSGHSFYGYMKESEDVLQKLQAHLQDRYKDSQPTSGQRYQKGDYVVSRYSDGMWYRAKILDVVPNSQTFQVMFVDYGAEEEKNAADFRKMEPEFMKLAPQCLCLSLSGVSAMPVNDLKTFAAWVEGNNPCQGKVMEVSEDLISIRLHAIGDTANCINDKLAPKASIPLSPKKVDKSPQRTQERSVTFGGDSKVSSNDSAYAKVGAEKTKDRHQGEGKAILPEPVQKTLKVNDSMKLEITGINQSGQSFYGYVKESEEVLQKLQARLQDCYRDSQPSSGQRFQKGDYIVSRFSDGMWYRARILEAAPNSQTFQVMFVDYGAEEEKSAEDFRKMEPEFMKLAPQCLCLSLSGVSAMSVNDLKTFAAWVEGNNPCQGQVVKISDDLISIRLHVIGDKANCINDKLAPQASIPLSPQKTDKSRTPDRSGPGGDATSSPRKENKRILSVGENHQIAVVDGTSPGKFYACLLKDEKDISHLSEELAKAYGDSKPVKNFKPQVGQQCVAKFEGCWYRAEVRAVAEKDQYEVFYIDYGNSSVVELDQCRPVSPQFQEATPFALCLGLENIKEECPREYFSRFIEWVSKDGVEAKIVGEVNKKYLVRLFRVGNEEECLNDILSGVNAKAPLPVPPLVSSVSLGTILDIVILSKQENPDFFYACLVNQQEELSELHSDVQTAYVNQGENSKFHPEVGKVCCVKYIDGCFYRAVVKKIAGSTLQILLLDYSDVAEVNIPDCYPLEDKFMRTPAFALRFRLEASAEMTPDFLNKFQNLDPVACKFEVTRKDGDVLVGIMWQTDAPEERFNGSSKDKGATPSPPKKNVEPESEKAVTKKKKTAVSKKEDSPVITKNFLKASALVKPPVPQIGKLLPASLTFLDNPNLIYFHLCFTETLDIIKSTINDPEFLKLKDSMKEYEPMKGELCMAFAVDQWCRAEVINIKGSAYNLSILDYGGEVTLSKKDIRPAPPTFLQTKLACVKCSLFGVEPLGMKTWSTKAKDFVRKELEEGQKIVQLKVMAVEDDVLQVDILIPSENNRHRSLSQKLTADGLSKQMLVTTEPVVSIPHPPDKAELMVTVNGINSPGDFYCQVVDEESLKLIQTLMGAIMEFVSQSSADEDFNPSVNQFCLGQFSEDQQWYRVQVVSVSEEGKFKIRFIDFGNYETVPRNCLRPLPGHFVEPCAMAFPCCLLGFETNAGEDTEAVTALSELTKNGLVAFKGNVKRTCDYRTVICLTDRETGKDVSEELMKMVGNPSESPRSKPKASNKHPSPTTREAATSNGHPAATGGQATKPTPNGSSQPDSTMSELERLRAELEAREAENRRLKELLERK